MQKFFSKNFAYMIKTSLHFLQLEKNFIKFCTLVKKIKNILANSAKFINFLHTCWKVKTFFLQMVKNFTQSFEYLMENILHLKS